MDLDILDMDFNDSSKTTATVLPHTAAHQKQDQSPCHGIDCLKRAEQDSVDGSYDKRVGNKDVQDLTTERMVVPE